MVNLVILSEWAQRYYSKGNISTEAQFVVEDILPQAFAFIRQRLSQKINKYNTERNRAIRDAINAEFLKEASCLLVEKEEICGHCVYYYDITFDFMTLPFDLGIYNVTTSCGDMIHKVRVEDFSALNPQTLAILGMCFAIRGRRLLFANIPTGSKINIQYVMDCFNLLDENLFSPTDVLPCPPESENDLYLEVGKWVDAITNGGQDNKIEGADIKTQA